MAPGIRRYLAAAIALFCVVSLWRRWGPGHAEFSAHVDQQFLWRRIKHNYPVTSFRPLPTARGRLPPVQATFAPETAEERQIRLTRQQTVKDAFQRGWRTYKDNAWLRDEVTPVSGKPKDTFGGWGATLIDSLDTLLMMDMKDEFAEAVDAVHRHVSFETTPAEEINVFETTIRFLGGLLSAFDMSDDARLLSKARDVGDLLYKAFDTPNHLPIARWDLHAAAKGESQAAMPITLVAELGSLCMEFARLSLVTGDPKYYDAVQHISELFSESQMKTKLPGMWPVVINAAEEQFDAGADYSIGGMADSMYEYLPKMMALLGDGDGIYRDMYLQSMDTVTHNILFRPMLPNSEDILFPGSLHVEAGEAPDPATKLQKSTGHLTCFAGGMFALGGRLTSSESHLAIAEKLTSGCAWAYSSTTTGVMPEVFQLSSCASLSVCQWDEARWRDDVRRAQANDKLSEAEVKALVEKERLPQGVTGISDPKYILRPEAIESVFVMYRVTGDPHWREAAWEMWMSIDTLTHTEMTNSAVKDANHKPGEESVKLDSMESFWMGETLKYFYLIFSDPDLVSLDEWVFNTEAHPFRRLG